MRTTVLAGVMVSLLDIGGKSRGWRSHCGGHRYKDPQDLLARQRVRQVLLTSTQGDTVVTAKSPDIGIGSPPVGIGYVPDVGNRFGRTR